MSLVTNTYTFQRQFVALSAAKTLLQVVASTTRPLEIVEMWFSQSTSVTSAQYEIALIRKSAAATVTAAVAGDFVKHNPSDSNTSVQLGTALSGYNATAEGTDTDTYRRFGVNSLSAFCYLPLSDERFVVPAAGIVAVKLFGTIPSATYNCGLTLREIG